MIFVFGSSHARRVTSNVGLKGMGPQLGFKTSSVVPMVQKRNKAVASARKDTNVGWMPAPGIATTNRWRSCFKVVDLQIGH